MKRETVRLLSILTFSALLAGGCVYHHTDRPRSEVVVVREPPPAPQAEVVGVAPSASDVWINGYWAYRHGRYVWVPGHWQTRPRAGAAWIAGHWDHTSEGWMWTPGHWE